LTQVALKRNYSVHRRLVVHRAPVMYWCGEYSRMEGGKSTRNVEKTVVFVDSGSDSSYFGPGSAVSGEGVCRLW
jgi:hypothetical protein